MIPNRLLLLASSTILLGSDHLRCRPAPDLELRKAIRTSFELGFEELTSRMNGMDVPKEYLPELEIDVQRSGELVVVDRYRQAKDGTLLDIGREYERIFGSYRDETSMYGELVDSGSGEGSSALEGLVVSFRLDGEGEWECAFEGKEGDPDLLVGLAGDLDMLGLLPDSEVSAGDSWEIDPAVFARLVLHMGGDLKIDGLEDQGEPAMVDDDPEGSITARCLGTRELEGRSVSAVALEGTLTLVQSKKATLEHIPVADGTATETATTVYDFEGTLNWDTAAEHLRSLDLSASVSVSTRLVKDENQGAPFESTVRLGGTFELTMAVE